MANLFDKLNNHFKKNIVYGLIISSSFSFLVGGMLSDTLTTWAIQQYGISDTFVIILVLVFCLMLAVLISVITISHIEKKRRKTLIETNTIFEPLNKRYKGLIASVSLLDKPKDEIKEIIDSDELIEIYKIRGIGQTLRAIKHHLGELKVCWLLCTEDVDDSLEMVEHFIKINSKKTIYVKKIKITDPYCIEEVFKKINTAYSKGVKEYDLDETDVIADLTGGTSVMSCAMVLSCLSIRRDLEYVLQNSYNLIEIKENVSEIAYDR